MSLPNQRSKRLNVVDLMNRNNDLSTYVFEGSITSAVIANHPPQTLKLNKQITLAI